jgi:hypothetical protein
MGNTSGLQSREYDEKEVPLGEFKVGDIVKTSNDFTAHIINIVKFESKDYIILRYVTEFSKTPETLDYLQIYLKLGNNYTYLYTTDHVNSFTISKESLISCNVVEEYVSDVLTEILKDLPEEKESEFDNFICSNPYNIVENLDIILCSNGKQYFIENKGYLNNIKALSIKQNFLDINNYKINNIYIYNGKCFVYFISFLYFYKDYLHNYRMENKSCSICVNCNRCELKRSEYRKYDGYFFLKNLYGTKIINKYEDYLGLNALFVTDGTYVGPSAPPSTSEKVGEPDE